MLWLFRFLKGYLYLSISGNCVENLLNAAARSRITFWDLRCKRCGVFGKISIKDYRRLRLIRKPRTAKIKIISRHGLPFKTVRLRKKIGFLAGAVIFFALLYFLSGFVWVIKSEGNSSVSEAEIISACKRLGVYEGVAKSKIKSKLFAQRLLIDEGRLAWCSFNVEGCVLTVDVTESTKTDELRLPSNIKAAESGVIKKIDVTSGNVLCRVGDYACKGDLLVSGVSGFGGSTVFSRAAGEITAETVHTVSAEGKFSTRQVCENGKVIKRSVLELFGLKIPLYLGKVRGKYNARVECHSLYLFGQRLPVRITVKEYSMLSLEEVDYSADELKQRLNREIDEKIKIIGAEEYECVGESCTADSEGITLQKTYKCTENIAAEEKIILDTKN